MAISSMQQPRQMYGLGSFVRKAKRGLKKVFKSPLGKAALIGAGAYGLNKFGPTTGFLTGTGNEGFNKYGILNRLKGKGGDGFLASVGDAFRKDGERDKGFSMGRLGLGALGLAAVASPFLQGEEEEEIVSDPFSMTPSSISDIRNMARMRDPSLAFMPQSRYVQPNYYAAANGGIARLSNGGGAGQEQMMQALQAEYMKYKQQGGTMPFEQFAKLVMQQQQGGQQTQMAANGGRIGYAEAGPVMQEDVEVIDKDQVEVASNNENTRILELLFEKYLDMGMSSQEAEAAARMEFDKMSQAPAMQEQETIVEDRVMANAGGMIDYMSSANPMAKSYLMEDTDIVNMYRPGDNRQMAAEGGIMDLGGMEKDYRAEGGFVPLGGQEKADDVPARLSKNEFVFTADAVRNAGGGDIDQGAAVMERMMDHLEQGGQVSEESQGGNPAQEMFETSQQLESRIA